MATKKPKTLKAIKPNLGIEIAYRKALDGLITDMNQSVLYWVKAQYRKNPPVLANDASPSDDMQDRLNEVTERWLSKIDGLAPAIAEKYVKGMFKHTDSAFAKALKQAGWAVDFKMTPAMRDSFDASLAENVGLIRNIGEKYLYQIQGAVMRSYSMGRDLSALVESLQKIYPMTKRRAKFIAIDQSNKANAVVNKARQLELGITDAIWMHSHAGKEPRQDHVKANGRRYKIAEGCLISSEYIQPGELPNCRCTSRAVLPF